MLSRSHSFILLSLVLCFWLPHSQLVNATAADSISTFDVFSSFLGKSVSPDEFFSQYFEHRSLLVKRNSEAFYSPSFDAIERTRRAASTQRQNQTKHSLFDFEFNLSTLALILDTSPSAFSALPAATSESRLTLSDLRLVKRIKAADQEWWSAVYPLERLPADKRPDAELAKYAMGKGFTLVLNRVNYRHEPIARLCSQLSKEIFGFRIQANLYYTPINATGFEAHFDWQESLVFQLFGKKKWDLHTPQIITLPRADQKFKPRQKRIEDELKKQTVRLLPGSMLYFPSGMIHAATTAIEKNNQVVEVLPSSMHLTLGIEVDPIYTMQGLLHKLIDHLSKSDSQLQKELTKSIILPECDATASASAEDESISLLDLLHWTIFDASSRADEDDALAPNASRFRASLWGLHRFNSSALDAYSAKVKEIPMPVSPSPESQSQFVNSSFFRSILEQPSTTTAVNTPSNGWASVPRSVQQSLHLLVRTSERVLDLFETLENDVDFQMNYLVHRLLQMQTQMEETAREEEKRLKRGITESLNPNEFSSPLSPSQSKYEYDHIFSDPILAPFIQKLLQQRSFSKFIKLMMGGGAQETSWCVQRFLETTRNQLRDMWNRMKMQLGDVQKLQPFNQAFHANIPSNHALPTFLRVLQQPLSVIHSILVESTAAHEAQQSMYVKENLRRQSLHVQKLKAEQPAPSTATSKKASNSAAAAASDSHLKDEL